MTSREFNQDTSGAKKAADLGPVYITDRGKAAYVLLSFDGYQRLLGERNLIELLGATPGIEDVEFEPPRSREMPRPATFD
jgi:hypothetical protein